MKINGYLDWMLGKHRPANQTDMKEEEKEEAKEAEDDRVFAMITTVAAPLVTGVK